MAVSLLIKPFCLESEIRSIITGFFCGVSALFL